MTHQCTSLEELSRFTGELPVDFADCARCSALHAALRSFLEGDSQLDAESLEDAERRSEEWFRRQLLDESGLRGAEEQPSSAASQSRSPLRSERWPRHRLRWTLAVAAVLAVAVLGVRSFVIEDAQETVEPIYRGVEPGAPIDPYGFDPGTLRASNSEYAFEWLSVGGADHYTIELFNADLDFVDTLGPFTATAAQVLRPNWPASLRGKSFLYRIHAWSGEDLIESSLLGSGAAEK